MWPADTCRNINTYRESSSGPFFALPTCVALILAVVYDIKYDSSNNPPHQGLPSVHYPMFGPLTKKVAHPRSTPIILFTLGLSFVNIM